MSRQDIENTLIRNLIAKTDKVTYFGLNSVVRAILSSIAFVIDEVRYEIEMVRRKLFFLTSTGTDLDELAATRGIVRRADATPASVLLEMKIDSTFFTDAEGTTNPDGTEVKTLWSELKEKLPGYDITKIVVPKGMIIASNDGVEFKTLSDFIIDKESTVRSYAIESSSVRGGLDTNVFSGSVVEGPDGANIVHVPHLTCAEFEGFEESEKATFLEVVDASISTLTKTLRINNPAPAQGGRDQGEHDNELRYRAVRSVSVLNQGTPAFFEALIRDMHPSNKNLPSAVKGIRIGRILVLRDRITKEDYGSYGNAIRILVTSPNGLPLDEKDRAQIEKYVADRMPALTTIKVDNIPFTHISLKLRVMYEAGVDIAAVNSAIAKNLTDYIDFNKWPLQEIVELGDEHASSVVSSSDIIRVVEQTKGVDRLKTNTEAFSMGVIQKNEKGEFRKNTDGSYVVDKTSNSEIKIEPEHLPRLSELQIVQL